jgi:ABC-2 type transport system permease protein
MPVPISHLYLAKLTMATLMVIITQVWIGVLFILSGKLCGLSAPIPPELLEWLLYGAAGGIVICAVQLCISIVIRSFAVPVAIALMGGIAGLAAIAKGVGVFLPYSLLSLGMRANNPGGAMFCSVEAFFLSAVTYFVICILFAILWMKNRDVVAT